MKTGILIALWLSGTLLFQTSLNAKDCKFSLYQGTRKTNCSVPNLAARADMWLEGKCDSGFTCKTKSGESLAVAGNGMINCYDLGASPIQTKVGECKAAVSPTRPRPTPPPPPTVKKPTSPGLTPRR